MTKPVFVAEPDYQQARLREDVVVAVQGAAVLLRDGHPARLPVPQRRAGGGGVITVSSWLYDHNVFIQYYRGNKWLIQSQRKLGMKN